MADTELGQQRIDCANLNATPPAGITQICGSDMVLPFWCYHGQGTKSFDQHFCVLWAAETLQQFLQNDACERYCLAGG